MTAQTPQTDPPAAGPRGGRPAAAVVPPPCQHPRARQLSRVPPGHAGVRLLGSLPVVRNKSALRRGLGSQQGPGRQAVLSEGPRARRGCCRGPWHGGLQGCRGPWHGGVRGFAWFVVLHGSAGFVVLHGSIPQSFPAPRVPVKSVQTTKAAPHAPSHGPKARAWSLTARGGGHRGGKRSSDRDVGRGT